MNDSIVTEQIEFDWGSTVLDDGAVWVVPVIFDWDVPTDLYTYENLHLEGV